jgi:polysaccharide biosynthesis protein PelF
VPVIATDVGACRELIEGSATNGREFGHAGRIVPIADPDAIAAAALELLSDPQQWHAAQQAGIQRVERYYRQEQVIAEYRGLYREAMR